MTVDEARALLMAYTESGSPCEVDGTISDADVRRTMSAARGRRVRRRSRYDEPTGHICGRCGCEMLAGHRVFGEVGPCAGGGSTLGIADQHADPEDCVDSLLRAMETVR